MEPPVTHWRTEALSELQEEQKPCRAWSAVVMVIYVCLAVLEKTRSHTHTHTEGVLQMTLSLAGGSSFLVASE